MSDPFLGFMMVKENYDIHFKTHLLKKQLSVPFSIATPGRLGCFKGKGKDIDSCYSARLY